MANDFQEADPHRGAGTLNEASSDRRCGQCGASVREGTRFCTKCGNPLDGTASAECLPARGSAVSPGSVCVEAPPAEGSASVRQAPQRVVAGGNVTFVQNTQTVAGPRRLVCAICGTSQIEDACFKCRRCGRWICQSHQDVVHLTCWECAQVLEAQSVPNAAARGQTAVPGQALASSVSSQVAAAVRPVARPTQRVSPPAGPAVISTTATLSIRSDPADAEVLVDSRLVGHTPLDYPVDLGVLHQRQVEVLIRKERHQSQAALIHMRRGEVSQWHGVVLTQSTAAGLPDPTEVEVKDVRVEPLEVEVQPCVQPSPPIKGLPPLPAEMREMAGVLEGLRRAITRLRDGTHPSLKKAQAAVRQAQEQHQQLRRDLEEHGRSLPSHVRRRLLDEATRNPACSVSQLAALAPQLSTDLVLRWLCAFRNSQNANRVADQAQAAYEQARQAKIAELQEQANDIERDLLPRLEQDFTRIALALFEKTDVSSGFPVQAWLKLEPLLAQRSYPWDNRTLVIKAEALFRDWPDHRAWRKACRANTVEALQEYLAAMPHGRHAAEARARWEQTRSAAPGQPDRNQTADSWSSGVGMVFQLIPAGQFEMGASPGDRTASANEKPAETVVIERPFWAAAFPLTNAMLRRFLEGDDTVAGRAAQLRGDRSFARAVRAGSVPDDLPAVGINASDAEILCEWLRGLDGRPYRLPTEAEWEFMARAESTGAYWWADEDDPQKRAVVGSSGPAAADPQRANPWGLIDVLGNVWEWTSSTYEPLASGAASRAAGPLSSEARVVRGGSWRVKTASDIRVFRRRSMSMRTRADDLGVRLVCDV